MTVITPTACILSLFTEYENTIFIQTFITCTKKLKIESKNIKHYDEQP